MLKSIIAVMAAAAIASVLTLLSAASARLDAGPLAKPAETALKACTQQPCPISTASAPRSEIRASGW
jgi:hypothetical protein